MEPPLCECHGVSMYWHKMKKHRAGGLWRCRERRKQFDAARWQGYYYERMPTTMFIRRRLDLRRRKALESRRERQQRED